jgi:hypothetical protein
MFSPRKSVKESKQYRSGVSSPVLLGSPEANAAKRAAHPANFSDVKLVTGRRSKASRKAASASQHSVKSSVNSIDKENATPASRSSLDKENAAPVSKRLALSNKSVNTRASLLPSNKASTAHSSKASLLVAKPSATSTTQSAASTAARSSAPSESDSRVFVDPVKSSRALSAMMQPIELDDTSEESINRPMSKVFITTDSLATNSAKKPHTSRSYDNRKRYPDSLMAKIESKACALAPTVRSHPKLSLGAAADDSMDTEDDEDIGSIGFDDAADLEDNQSNNNARADVKSRERAPPKSQRATKGKRASKNAPKSSSKDDFLSNAGGFLSNGDNASTDWLHDKQPELAPKTPQPAGQTKTKEPKKKQKASSLLLRTKKRKSAVINLPILAEADSQEELSTPDAKTVKAPKVKKVVPVKKPTPPKKKSEGKKKKEVVEETQEVVEETEETQMVVEETVEVAKKAKGVKKAVEAELKENDALTPGSLPKGWSKRISTKYNRVFYYHSETKESVWVRPPSQEEEQEEPEEEEEDDDETTASVEAPVLAVVISKPPASDVSPMSMKSNFPVSNTRSGVSLTRTNTSQLLQITTQVNEEDAFSDRTDEIKCRGALPNIPTIMLMSQEEGGSDESDGFEQPDDDSQAGDTEKCPTRKTPDEDSPQFELAAKPAAKRKWRESSVCSDSTGSKQPKEKKRAKSLFLRKIRARQAEGRDLETSGGISGWGNRASSSVSLDSLDSNAKRGSGRERERERKRLADLGLDFCVLNSQQKKAQLGLMKSKKENYEKLLADQDREVEHITMKTGESGLFLDGEFNRLQVSTVLNKDVYKALARRYEDEDRKDDEHARKKRRKSLERIQRIGCVLQNLVTVSKDFRHCRTKMTWIDDGAQKERDREEERRLRVTSNNRSNTW